MLAEKFFLVLESLIRGGRTYPDGSPRVISTSPHVPVKLPEPELTRARAAQRKPSGDLR